MTPSRRPDEYLYCKDPLVSMNTIGSNKRTWRTILGIPQKRRQYQFSGLADRSGSLPGFTPGNQISLLENGAAYFSAIENAFDRARNEIYLGAYIFAADATGWRIADALVRAVRRGVKVHLLVDGYGSKNLGQALLERLREGGVKILVYRPKISPWTFRRKRLRRMHWKVVVVDREIAFVGGINIIDDRETTGARLPRYDYAVAVEGPLVKVIRHSAKNLWSLVTWNSFHNGTIRGRKRSSATYARGEMSAAFLVRDNFRHRRAIEAAYLRGINQAKTEIILANAYFFPGRDFRRALVRAAGRGVRVVLLLQGRCDHRLQHYATQALYGHFLAAGIEIYEFHQSFLHAKVAVIDGSWATVGSSNIDPFSLLLAREANIVVDGREFGSALAQSLKRNMESDALQISIDGWKLQPARLRVISWLSYGLLRLMMGISGYRRENSGPGKDECLRP